MTQLGLGVMINLLAGWNTHEAIKESLGKTIYQVTVDDDTLRFEFTDKSILRIWDGGQSCCESRYMNTDDDLTFLFDAGATLVNVDVVDGPEDEEGDYGDVTESQYLRVTTSKGDFTVVNYNSHNGYYGGFSINSEIL